MTEVLRRLRFGRDHRWAPGHMSDYLDGELPARGRVRLERHTEECPDCRGVLGALRRLVGALHGLSRRPASAHAWDIAAAVRSRMREPASD
jgi:anti-sigma factor RsiW